MSGEIRIAILGATGAVGVELIKLLETRSYLKVAELKLLASPRSAGKTLRYREEEVKVEAVSEASFKGIDLVLASAGSSTTKIWAKKWWTQEQF